ncbi:MAG: sensor histidine kinase [Candidatus Hodarchaeales archaeon]|jgi:PAS domain S-box-containing protein
MTRDKDKDKDYKSIFENVPIGLYRATPEGKILDANPALVEMLKYDSFEELALLDLEDTAQYHPAYPRQAFRERIEREGEIKGLHSLWKSKEGSLIYIQENARAIRGDDGSVLYYEGTVEDISEQKKAIEKLLGKEKQYRSMIEKSSESIIMLDDKGTIRYISPAVQDLIGYNVDEFFNKELKEFIHPNDISKLYNAFQQVTKEPDTIISTEYRMKHKNGSWRVIESISMNLIYDKAVSGVIISSRDITKRIEKEERLKNSVEIERFLASLSARFINLEPNEHEESINNALKAIGEYFRVEYGYIFLFIDDENEAKTYEWRAEEFDLPLNILSRVPIDYSSWWFEKLGKYETINISSVHDLPPEANEEKKQLLDQGIQSLLAVPLFSSGKLVGFIGFHSVKSIKKWLAEELALVGMFAQTFSNTLQQKRIQDMIIKQKEELRLFIDILTHDMRNYHLVTRENLDMSLDTTVIDTGEQTEFLQQSLAGLINAENVVNNVSILMKHQLSYDYELIPINILETVNRTTETLVNIFPDKKLQIIADRVPPETNILADALFEQLVLNLLTNAVKSDINEVVKVEIIVDMDISRKTCLVTITDNGKGIPEKQREEIFDRFTTFRKEGKGSGLGLYIVKTLVERYKGKIWVESRVPGDYKMGTKFKIELQAL